MLQEVNGIMLHSIPYGDASLVVKLFTREHGMQSYLVNGVRKVKAKFNPMYFQPCVCLQLVVYYKPNGSLQRISSLRAWPSILNIHSNIVKTSITQFITEVCYRVLYEHPEDELLYDFLESTILSLDKQNANLSNFSIIFLLKFSKFLGFYPDFTSEGQYFNIMNGVFEVLLPTQHLGLGQEISSKLKKLHDVAYDTPLSITNEERRILLEALLAYFHFHIPSMGTIHAHTVLNEVFS